MVVLGDLAIAAGQLWVLKPGTSAVLYDIDGTITPGDEEIIKQVRNQKYLIPPLSPSKQSC